MVRPSPAPENPLPQIGKLSRRSGLSIKTLRYYHSFAQLFSSPPAQPVSPPAAELPTVAECLALPHPGSDPSVDD